LPPPAKFQSYIKNLFPPARGSPLLGLAPIMDDLEKNFDDQQDKGIIDQIAIYRGGPLAEGGIKWISNDIIEIKTQDKTGYHLFRIAVVPSGKSFTRTMTFLGPLDK
jgi:hypothetical protein